MVIGKVRVRTHDTNCTDYMYIYPGEKSPLPAFSMEMKPASGEHSIQMYGANRKVYYLTGIVGGGGYAIQTVNICMRETEMYVQFPRVTVKLTPA